MTRHPCLALVGCRISTLHPRQLRRCLRVRSRYSGLRPYLAYPVKSNKEITNDKRPIKNLFSSFTHLPGLQTGTGGTRNIGDASAVHSSGCLLTRASISSQTGRPFFFIHTRGTRPVGVIVHLSTDFEVGHPLSGRHPRYVNLLERRVRLISMLRVLLEVNVLVRMMIPRLRVAPCQMPVGMGGDGWCQF